MRCATGAGLRMSLRLIIFGISAREELRLWRGIVIFKRCSTGASLDEREVYPKKPQTPAQANLGKIHSSCGLLGLSLATATASFVLLATVSNEILPQVHLYAVDDLNLPTASASFVLIATVNYEILLHDLFAVD